MSIVEGYKGGKSPVAWIGGKSRAKDDINNVFESADYDNYVEIFAGGAHLYFRKKPSEKEFLNDINIPLTRFYSQLKDGVDLSACNTYPTQEKFDDAKNRLEAGKGSPCDFLFVNKMSFNGTMVQMRKNHSCDDRRDPTKCGISNLTPDKLGWYEDRMKNTNILNMDYRDVVKLTDSPRTLIYADPPYEGKAKPLYRVDPDPVEPEVVADTFKNIQGKVVVSLNDSPHVREAFSSRGFHILPIEFHYSASAKGYDEEPTRELLITNWDSGCKWTDQGMQCPAP